MSDSVIDGIYQSHTEGRQGLFHEICVKKNRSQKLNDQLNEETICYGETKEVDVANVLVYQIAF
jgi:hypothetical protein